MSKLSLLSIVICIVAFNLMSISWFNIPHILLLLLLMARLACRDKKQITSLICTIYVPGHKGQSAAALPRPVTPTPTPRPPLDTGAGKESCRALRRVAASAAFFRARALCARAEFVNLRQHQMQRVLQIHKKDSKRQKALKQKPEKCPQRLQVAAPEGGRGRTWSRGGWGEEATEFRLQRRQCWKSAAADPYNTRKFFSRSLRCCVA